ncbi:MAG: thiamine diphosphokinase [Eubacteriales bacterium]|nr:thiamine diphosphokinase [Eubacteriales bacterium]MDY3333002.1 thiamine diphosphokinase [Gallibacter sp.]
MNTINKLNKATIITSYIEGNENEILKLLSNAKNTYIICADGGYEFALKANIVPNLIVGDFDSLNTNLPTSVDIIKVPTEKDDTDLQLALKICLKKNITNVDIIGGIGGRVDHTIGNIQNLVHYTLQGININMFDTRQIITIQLPSTKKYHKKSNYQFSLFAHSEFAEGVTITGGHYSLNNDTINNSFPIGISNQFEEDYIEVSFESGILVIVMSSL